MQTCQACGRERNGTAKFCTGCGAVFPDYIAAGNVARKERSFGPGPAQNIDLPIAPEAAEPAAITPEPFVPPPVPAGPELPELPEPPEPKRPARSILMALAVLLAVGLAGSGSWFLVRTIRSHPGPGTHTAAGPVAHPARTPAASASSTPSAASPSPAPSAESVGTVAVASAAAQDADASGVADFLNRYFAAINSHDYQSYAALLDAQMRQDLTAAEFNSGYQSTTDSGETLVSTSTAADGDTVAAVTFTSHQNPADSINHQESCTNWQITLFLENGGTGYLIGPAPAGYHASSAACP